METRRGPRKPPADRRARSLDRSLDRSQAPRKDSESGNCQCLSLSTSPCRRALRRTSSDGATYSGGPHPSAEAQGAVAAAVTLQETRELLPSDTKKDKAQKGWLKTLLNFFLRTGPEEPKEKVSRRPKGKEELTEPLEGPGEPALRKKAHDKKVGRKKHGLRKHATEETQGAQDQEAAGQEAGLPRTAARRGEQTLPFLGGQVSHLHQASPSSAGGAGLSDTPPQAAGPQPEEELRKPDEDAVIRRIVEFLKKVGDQWEEEQIQVPQSEVALQNPAPVCKRKSQEKKCNLKRAFSLKKHSSEEPKRAGAADVPSPEARQPKKPSFLPMCVGSHRSSISSSPGLEESEVHEALTVDGEGPSPSEPSAQARCQGSEEELSLDGPSESNEFIQKILALLQDAEEQEGEQYPQVQEAEVSVENLAPLCRKKSQDKKYGLRRAFSHKKHGSKEPKRAGTAGSASPEARPLKRPSVLPLCVGGHRASISSSSDPEGPEFKEPLAAEGGSLGLSAASSQARSHKPEGGPQPEGTCESKELMIVKLVTLLQEVDGDLGKQIRRHPSFKRFFYEFSDSSLRKLVATLQRQKTHSQAGDKSLAERSSPFAYVLVHKFADNQSRTICSLMGSRGHYSQHGFAQFPSGEAQQNNASPEVQSPD